ncbi:Velvet domain-containing protein [Mycena kentingensis (nom. inval.)]|nr:Velvet domain-containing protein [Mycena kentingensis (nom. inval.)]
MDSATPTKIDGIQEELLGRKLRVAGQVLAYDPYTGIALLRASPGGKAIALDVGECVGAWPAGNREWLSEHLTTATVIGYLERRTDLKLPALPRHVSAPRMVDGMALNVLLIVSSPELDLGLWESGIDALARVAAQRAEE